MLKSFRPRLVRGRKTSQQGGQGMSCISCYRDCLALNIDEVEYSKFRDSNTHVNVFGKGWALALRLSKAGQGWRMASQPSLPAIFVNFSITSTCYRITATAASCYHAPFQKRPYDVSCSNHLTILIKSSTLFNTSPLHSN